MRLLTRHKLYRAFAELDPYDDATCERFLESAKGSWSRRWGRRSACVGIAIISMILLGIGILWLGSAWIKVPTGHEGLMVAMVMVPAVVGPFVAILQRDALLWSRVRYVLRRQGCCGTCGYSLIGLSLDDANQITCPECGTLRTVDRSLAVLATDESGRTKIESFNDAPSVAVFWTPSRKKRLKLGIAGFLVFFVLIPGMLFGIYEAFLRLQASRARGDRVSMPQLLALIERTQPADGQPGTPNAWELFDRMDARAQGIDRDVSASSTLVLPDGETVEPYFDFDPNPPAPEKESERYQLAVNKAACDKLIARYREAGVLNDLATIAATPRAVRVPHFDPTIANPTIIDQWIPSLGRCRHYARVNRGRMSNALQANDMGEYLAALDQTLAIAQMLARQGTLIDQLVAVAIHSLAFEGVRDCMMKGPDRAWLDGISSALDRRQLSINIAQVVAVESLIGQDALAQHFGDVGKVRFGRFNTSEGRLYQGDLARMGTYAECLDTMNEYYQGVLTYAADRSATTPELLLSRRTNYFTESLTSFSTKAFASLNLPEATTAGLRIWIAIERYRNTTGTLPGTLSELVPTYLPAIPTDVDGQPLIYFKLVDPASDRLRRTYLVYSRGYDGTDSGGVEFHGKSWPEYGAPGFTGGTDRVYNSDR